ncbi:MAG: pitrilysin family protein, partial [Candidatus Cloacimonadales bacterium]|nr:pitrilysin family protein [Candidatus Cloacimonadales bacterium]
MKKFILFASLFTLLLSLHALDLSSPLPIDPTVKIGKLDNGLTYYLKKNSVPENKAELRLVVNAGSVLEDDNQVGLAHFCEHMAFNGTQNFAKSEMTDYLASIGLGFAGGLNAYTSMDETIYMLKSSTNDKAQLKKSIFILSEWANKVSFDDDEIEKERGVIIEEWRGGRGANERISNKESKVILKDSKYAERSPIGTYEIISTFKPQTIKNFYKDWYRPDLQAVVVVGDINIDEVESYIIEYFATIPKSVNPRTRVIEPVPDHTETLVSIESDKELSNSSVTLYIKSELEPVITIQDYKRDLTKSLFYSMFNNRLQELTKQENSPFLYAFTFSYPMVRSKNLL